LQAQHHDVERVAVVGERRVVVLEHLHERRQLALGRPRRIVVEALAVLLHTELEAGLEVRDLGVARGPEVRGNEPGSVQVLVLLEVVPGVARLGVVGLGMGIPVRAELRVAAEDVGHRRATVRDLQCQPGDVGQAGGIALCVDAADHVVDVVQEQRLAAHKGKVFAARLDDRVARIVSTQLGVDEVDDDLAIRDATALVEVLRPCAHDIDRPLEETRDDRVLDIGDDRDTDLVVGDADVRRLGLPALRRRSRQRGTDHRHDDQHHRQCTCEPHGSPRK
jgi:hypothetical protein